MQEYEGELIFLFFIFLFFCFIPSRHFGFFTQSFVLIGFFSFCFIFELSILFLLHCSLFSCSLRPSVCASVHLLKVLWQHHLLNINASPKNSLPARSATRSVAVCVYTLIPENHLL